MAEQIVDVVADQLDRGEKSDTARAALPGGDLENVQAEIGAATDITGDVNIATHLVHAYGSHWRRVWSGPSAVRASAL